MKKSDFEKRYMEKSWKKSKSKSYRTFDVDKSVKDFYSFLKLKKVKGNLLDLGCGNGRNTVFFEKKGFNVLGIDFAPSAVKVCKEYAKSKNSKANFVSGDVLKYPFKKNYFDVIVDCGCLHHIRKQYWTKYKNNLLKSIKEKGYFYLHGISDCAENKKLPKHPYKRKWVVKNGHYTSFFSKKDIQDFFGKDFKIIKTYEFKSEGSPLVVRAFYLQRR